MEQGKKRRWLHVPSPAMIVACVALFVALGGTSYAAATLAANSVGTRQLKNGAVTATKVGRLPGARVKDTQTTTVNTGVTAVLQWDSADFNVGGMYKSSAKDRLTARVPGRYLIIASVRWPSNVSGRRALALSLNGTTNEIGLSNVGPYASTTLDAQQTVECVYRLKAGDFVQVWAAQDSGSPLDLRTNVVSGVTFTMQWMAP